MSPYRTTTPLNGIADPLHTNNWTISEYDPLGRKKTITGQDGSQAHTAYDGVYTTVTDQSGRQRRQKVDSLGRIIRVDEPDATGNLGAFDSPTQATYYEYDTLGNLVHVIQGASPIQERFFKYDALSRLTYEHQVEQVGAFSASDPVTGQAAWYDLRVRIEKASDEEEAMSAPQFPVLTGFKGVFGRRRA